MRRWSVAVAGALGGCLWAQDVPREVWLDGCAECAEDQACDDRGICQDTCVTTGYRDIIGDCVGAGRVCFRDRCTLCEVAPAQCATYCDRDDDCQIDGYACCDQSWMDCDFGRCYLPD